VRDFPARVLANHTGFLGLEQEFPWGGTDHFWEYIILMNDLGWTAGQHSTEVTEQCNGVLPQGTVVHTI
jgi:hypothetical protein